MLFCSREFLFFFLGVFALYWLLPWHRLRIGLLLAASYTFYACWSHWLALLIAGSTVIDYFLARGMDASSSARLRRLLLTISLVLNLGLLVYFKYANFFLDSLGQVLHSAGLQASLPTLSVLLPIGISFYTFEAINYTVDVYRRRIPAEKDLAHFMLFILFFPHLVAGPIVRARDFLPQIRRPKRWSWPRLQLGVQFFLLGLLKKLAVADRMALYADPVFANPEAYGSNALWVAVLAYALQIYCDFSGYSDMAVGTAHMLGYKLARNFNLPYLATSIAEFWHRWHISLSTWLRDYLFIPLGGSRGGRWHTCRNLMLTMTLGGLWHGASWTFVVWGALHGLLLIGHRLFRDFCQGRAGVERTLSSPPGTLACGVATFLSVMLLWVFFRAPTFTGAMQILTGLFAHRTGLGSPFNSTSLWVTLLVVLVCHLLAQGGHWKRLLRRLPEPAQGLGYAAALLLALLLTPEIGRTFIYFQF
jgi:alginate O-acetyltransferase complex protein AlgI